MRLAYFAKFLIGSAVLASPAAAVAATCALEADVLTIQLAATERATIVGTGGVISVSGVACAPSAEVADARVLGPAASSERASIRLPGFAEAATIQWVVDLGDGGVTEFDTLTVYGTSAADQIRVGTLPDLSHGIDFDRNAEIDLSLSGVEYLVLDGGGGNDDLRGTLPAGAGAAPFSGPLRLWGGNGDDLLIGGAGHDDIAGEDGSDDLRGGVGDDDLEDGAGDDTVRGQTGNDVFRCGSGNDTFLGGAGDDVFLGDDALDGDDLFDGGTGDDYVSWPRTAGVTVDLALGVGGEAGETDTLVSIHGANGGSGDDTLRGSANGDFLNGNAGNDVIQGAGGNDLLWGGSGDDVVRGGAGLDTLFCGSGIDAWSDAADTASECENPL